MKSEPLPPAACVARADPSLLEELARRTHGLPAGSGVSLSDLESQDPFGAQAFELLARRFGVSRHADGNWKVVRLPRWTPAWIGANHEAQCFDLFEAAFGYRIDPRLWRWKYRDATRPGMGAWRDGSLVAFYGAMPRATLHFGDPVSTVQIGDVMVHPHERGVMTRSGPFQIAASTFIDRSVGFGRPHLFGFGFPTSKALQVAQKLGLYDEVDRMAELTWPAGRDWAARMWRSERLAPEHRAAVERAWNAMAQDFRGSVIGVRDFQYLDRRYLQHPTVAYECLVVRRMLTGTVQGLVVMRMADAQVAELMDFVAPRRNFPALVAVARRWAANKGAARLRAWVTASHAELLASTSPAAAAMDLVVPANVWSPGPSAQSLRGKWWLMAGDSDFR